MILDKIENRKLYLKTEIFESIFEELKTYTINTPNGVYQNNENYYFKVMTYDTKTNPSIIESHKKEVDIQIILSGSEHIKIYNEKAVTIKEFYDEKLDCQFYDIIGKPTSEIKLEPNYMAIFFPDDIHQPQFLVENKTETLKKIVIKVNEKLFT